MSDLNEVTEAMNARYMAKRLGLPQPGLFLTEDEVIYDVKARFDAKDARIAELERTVEGLTTSLRISDELSEDWQNLEGSFRDRIAELEGALREALLAFSETGSPSPEVWSLCRRLGLILNPFNPFVLEDDCDADD